MADEPQREERPPSLRRRRVHIGANLLVQTLAVVALVVMVNWLASRHYQRFDLTKTGYYQLADKTKQVLAALKEPVKVIVFLQPHAAGAEVEKIYEDVRNLLTEFQFFGKDRLQVEYVDPYRDLARAQQLVNEYKFDPQNEAGLVIFACGPRHKYVSAEGMVELDRSDFGGDIRIKAFKAEGEFLSAIQTVTEESSPKVYFLSGHGERDPEDYDPRRGYSTLAGYIKRDNVTVEKWNLLEKQSLPADASALILAGPRFGYTEPEQTMLEQYLKSKGRLLVLLDPRQKSGLEPLLMRWGVWVDDDLVVAKGGMMLGAELLIVDALGKDYAPHPITSNLQNVNTTFPYARSVRRIKEFVGAAADQPFVLELVKTPVGFWGETDLDAQRSTFDPNSDISGPLSLAVSVELGNPQEVKVDIGVTRMIVVGTSTFVDNEHIPSGNLDFFMNGLNWLLDRKHHVAVGPKVPQEFRLDMSPSQARAVYGLVVGGMPLAVAMIGLFVWSRRRK